MEELNKNFLTLLITLMALPWCIWVTVSLFNQRQEIALLKQIFQVLEKMIGSKSLTDP